MKLLFDQGTPAPLRRLLDQHEVATAFERGCSEMKNGDLLDFAEREGFDVLLTTDQKLHDQQNLSARNIAIVVLSTTSWPRIRNAATTVVRAIDRAATERYQRVDIP